MSGEGREGGDPHATTSDDLLAALPDLFFRVGGDDAFLELRGGECDLALPRERVLGRPVREVLPPPYADLLLAAAGRARESGELQVLDYELPPGSGRHFEARVVRAGAGPDVVVVVRNVTERRRAEAELRRALTDRAELERRLSERDRLAALGTLAAGMAHELNNPLTYVRGGLELVLERLRAAGLPAHVADPLLEALEDARGGVERIRRTVQGLQAFAAPEGRARVTLSLSAVVEKAMALVVSELRHRGRLVRLDEGAPPVCGDEGGLVQLVVGLLLNAAQAVCAGREAENEIRVVTRALEGQAVLEVHDTGHGIAPEHLPRVFDPYFSTRGVEGAGLGLSICHAIATTHGGTLTVESALGHGSVVRLALPAAPAAEAGAAPGAASVRRRVLLVDDEPRVLATTARLLRGEFEVEVAGDGQAALERIRAGARYDAIVCDLMMPNMTGMAFHAALAVHAPDLAARCAFLTGGAFTDEARRFLSAVPDRTLEKPFEASALRAMVRRLAAS